MSETSVMELGVKIRNQLRMVIDPEIGRNVIDIGLIYGIDVREDETVIIDMTTTTRGCPATGFLIDAVRECILDAALAQSVEVRLTYEPPWLPDMMSD